TSIAPAQARATGDAGSKGAPGHDRNVRVAGARGLSGLLFPAAHEQKGAKRDAEPTKSAQTPACLGA
ncbi:MAG: hypothetical protein M3O50_12230, partial [Myxococcota bacterium]|nr:hypothetical protein [Myxococcota bacterium]